MTLEQLNESTEPDAEAEFLKCCGARAWARAMAGARPFADEQEVLAKADCVSSSLSEEDWLEAFRAHPKIGEKKTAAAQTEQEASWAAQEQSAMGAASADTVARLARANLEYEAKFGFIFIICASGKSSDEMLSILDRRMQNDPKTELSVAAAEQKKITRLRLEKLLTS